ncbi:hypothetical protein D9741_10400 [Escherichia sp. E14V7]|nr:hypothetical protein D9740_07770 [Escherichia sp. E14V5]RZN04041.1 hypothetical protein D9741_10400 [Escherichia sp. E14V7]RZN24985.1 hypothetical protein D9739_18190 [Escherichia sp. E14V10]RZN47891.1 hypothetical protein D9597_12690 [Escherichia sp. E13S3]
MAIVALSVPERISSPEHFATPARGRLWKYLIASGFKTIRITSGKFDDKTDADLSGPAFVVSSAINNLAPISRCLISDK